MASKPVVDAIEGRLGNPWNGTLPVFGRNTLGDPPTDGTDHLVVQYPLAGEDVASLGDPGNNLHREEGAFRLVLHAQRGVGLHQALSWMEDLRALFRSKEFDGVITYAPSPAVEDDRNENGSYYVLSSSVPYEYDLTA